MSTIFPGSASVGQVYNNYTFDGTAWNINGIDLTENYLEESSASATYLTQASASSTYITQTAATANQVVYKNSSNAPSGSSGLIYDGTHLKVNGNLESRYSSGNEGGEIILNKPATNTTITDGVVIDVHQDRLRIFEQGSPNKGGYLDISKLGSGVGTNLVPGLTLVKKQTIGSGVSSVTVTDAFSSRYDNYKIIISGGGTAGNDYGYLRLGSSTSTYNYAANTLQYATAAFGGFGVGTNASEFRYVWSNANSTGYTGNIEIQNPFLSQYTRVVSDYATDDYRFFVGGVHKTASSYTEFTLGPNSGSGTMSGGIIYVYGYNKDI